MVEKLTDAFPTEQGRFQICRSHIQNKTRMSKDSAGLEQSKIRSNIKLVYILRARRNRQWNSFPSVVSQTTWKHWIHGKFSLGRSLSYQRPRPGAISTLCGKWKPWKTWLDLECLVLRFYLIFLSRNWRTVLLCVQILIFHLYFEVILLLGYVRRWWQGRFVSLILCVISYVILWD